MAFNPQKTLIIGASVSAAPVDRNPAKRFLRSRGCLAGAHSHAFNGRPGAHVLSQLRKSLLDQVTGIIAVDLMFWDSVMGLSDARESRALLRGFMKEVATRELPIVIGRIPTFHPFQLNADELNDAISRECKAYPLAKMLELDRLFASVSEGGITIDGRRYQVRDLLPDGLHPGPVAAEYIAQEIARLLPETADVLADNG